MPAEALGARPDDVVLVDVREPEEYAAGHVPGAVNLPQSELASRLAELRPATGVVVICQSGMRSTRAAQFLVQRGFRDVTVAEGGTDVSDFQSILELAKACGAFPASA